MKRPSDHPSLWQKGIALTWKSWFRFIFPVKPVVFLCFGKPEGDEVFGFQKLDLRTLSCGSWTKRRMAVCGFCCSQKCRCEKHGGFWPIFWVWKKRHHKLRSEAWGRHVLVNHGWEPYLGLACASNFAMAVEISSETSANLGNQFACPCSILSFLLCAD